MEYFDNWQETKERFTAWWNGKDMDRPMMRLVGRRDVPIETLEKCDGPVDFEDKHIGVEYNLKMVRNYCRQHHLLAEAFPYVNLNIGPGSMATYLGSEPNFQQDTVWFTECIDSWKDRKPFTYEPDNFWWKRHLDVIRKAKESNKDDILITIPDIVENVDILSAMRGPLTFCYDLVDDPDMINNYVHQIDDIYFKYYDEFYNIVKDEDGSSSYTGFSIWGPGRTCKVQCDFAVLMTPWQFKEIVKPSLAKQCRNLDFSLYHLDGCDAIKHLDALIEIENLNAIQWTPGAGKPDCGFEEWYPIYDKIRAAGKGVWISISDGSSDDWLDRTQKIIRRYGPDGFYFIYPEMSEADALKFLIKIDGARRI
ncbi:MAG: trimethylamine corrinoid protein 2 [Saccharofermentanales bacterium]